MPKDDFDRFADTQEHLADQARERLELEHNLTHNGDDPDCEFCVKEMENNEDA